MKKVGIVYFTGTGNTELGLNVMKKRFEDYGISCDLLLLGRDRDIPPLNNYDKVGFAAPVYHGYPAQMMIDFIESVDPDYLPKKAFTVLCCCFKPLDIGVWGAKEHFIDMLEERGVEITGQLRFFGEASHPFIRKVFLNNFTGIFMSGMFGKGCPGKKEVKVLQKFVDKLVNADEKIVPVKLPDSNLRRWLSTNLIRPIVEGRNDTLLVKSVDETKCNKCGICVRGCPSGAITMGSFPIIDKDLCVDCQKCINLCPKDATIYACTSTPGRYRGKKSIAS